MNEKYEIIEDGRKFVVIDERGEPKFDSYWCQDCRDWILEQKNESYDDDDY